MEKGRPEPTGRRRPARGRWAAAWGLALPALLATAGNVRAQATCQGGSFDLSSPRAPGLDKFTPVHNEAGVIFHAWLDRAASPQAGHVVVENTNPHPVAVRFSPALRGGSGASEPGRRCVMVRAHEYAVARAPATLFAYPGGNLWGVRVAGVEVARLAASAAPPPEPTLPVTVVDPARDPSPDPPPSPRPQPPSATRPADPRTDAMATPGQTAPAPAAGDTQAAGDTAIPADTSAVTGDTAAPAAIPPATPSDPVGSGDASPTDAPPATSETSTEGPDSPMRLVGPALRWVLGVLLGMLGVALALAVAAAAWLLLRAAAADLVHRLRGRPPRRLADTQSVSD